MSVYQSGPTEITVRVFCGVLMRIIFHARVFKVIAVFTLLNILIYLFIEYQYQRKLKTHQVVTATLVGTHIEDEAVGTKIKKGRGYRQKVQYWQKVLVSRYQYSIGQKPYEKIQRNPAGSGVQPTITLLVNPLEPSKPDYLNSDQFFKTIQLFSLFTLLFFGGLAVTGVGALIVSWQVMELAGVRVLMDANKIKIDVPSNLRLFINVLPVLAIIWIIASGIIKRMMN